MSTADTPNKPTSPKNSRELARDRLATTDAQGNRVYLYPADYKGTFRTLRTRVQAVLILIFLLSARKDGIWGHERDPSEV